MKGAARLRRAPPPAPATRAVLSDLDALTERDARRLLGRSAV